jgi:uncharacterized RDD family membrane protein YckC
MNTQSNVAVSASANPYAPPRASVRDISDPRVAAEPADRMTRLGAALLDSLVGFVIGLPLIVAIIVATPSPGDVPSDSTNMVFIAAFALSGIGVVAWALMTLKYVRENGQTIGKKLVNIKVVRSDGSKASLGRIFWLRNFVNGAVNIIPFYAIADHLFIFGEKRQCLHDKIADTIVVKA